jgi:hypothetical protein
MEGVSLSSILVKVAMVLMRGDDYVCEMILSGLSEEDSKLKIKCHDGSGMTFSTSLKAPWRSCNIPARHRCQHQTG